MEEELPPVKPAKAPKIAKTPKPKANRAAPPPVVPIKKAPSKKNNKSKWVLKPVCQCWNQSVWCIQCLLEHVTDAPEHSARSPKSFTLEKEVRFF